MSKRPENPSRGGGKQGGEEEAMVILIALCLCLLVDIIHNNHSNAHADNFMNMAVRLPRSTSPRLRFKDWLIESESWFYITLGFPAPNIR